MKQFSYHDFRSWSHCKKSLWFLQQQPHSGSNSESKNTAPPFIRGLQLKKCQHYINYARLKNAKILENTRHVYNQFSIYTDYIIQTNKESILIKFSSSTKFNKADLSLLKLQTLMLTKLNTPPTKIIGYSINKHYIRKDKISPKNFFKRHDLTDQITEDLEKSYAFFDDCLAISTSPNPPQVPIGSHCKKEKPCTFFHNCWPKEKPNDILNLNSLSFGQKLALINEGITTTDEIPENYPLSALQKVQVQAEKTNKIQLQKEKLGQFLNTISYPIGYLDFETYQPYISSIKGSTPNDHIPFLASFHYKETSNSPLKHYYKIVLPNQHPLETLEQFFQDLPDHTKTLLAFDPKLENDTLESLKSVSSNKEKLTAFQTNLIDLAKPFKEGSIYHPKMKGRFTLKAIYNAFFPNNNFTHIQISKGREAAIQYKKFLKTPQNTKLKEDLIAYSKLDTLSLAELHETCVNLLNPAPK